MKAERIFYLDAMRGILMILGIVIHSAQIYSPEAVLRVVNPDTSILMKYLVDSIHLFRMPAFFVVSGFFCYLTLEKYGVAKFFKVRLSRIAIPLVTCIFTLNVAMFYVLTATGWRDMSLTEFFVSGRYINHLWFLVDLIYFFVITALLHHVGIVQKITNVITSLPVFKKIPLWSLIFVLPFLTLGIMFLNKVGIPIYVQKYGVFAPYSILYNFVFFIFGYAMSMHRALYRSFTQLSPIISGGILAAALLLPLVIPQGQGILDEVVSEYTYILAQWCSISLCFHFFSRFLGNHSHLSAKLSDASYTVYLFHFLALMVLSVFLVKLALPALLGFTLSCVIVFAVTYLIHVLLIKKVAVLSYLFNGK
ncbi:acyltransferase family protein [Salinimonas chungwhensis]|uniref:acyltransferase family protein n=1 Tax=Salinimonas chungwhensis TaxID=265425 RepID=UPI00037AE685|nr:acyltransferase family protein [Salinimonas chungwhensis]